MDLAKYGPRALVLAHAIKPREDTARSALDQKEQFGER